MRQIVTLLRNSTRSSTGSRLCGTAAANRLQLARNQGRIAFMAADRGAAGSAASSHKQDGIAHLSRAELIDKIETLEQQLLQNASTSGKSSKAIQNGNSGDSHMVDGVRRRHGKKHSKGAADREHDADNPNDLELAAKKQGPRPFDISWYPCRKIALRFSYDGANYSGLEVQSRAAAEAAIERGEAPVKTIEGELWRALCEARLVDDAVGMQAVGWSRCGRTDRGVSSAGQVVALWVRSRRVDEWPLRRALARLSAKLKHGQGEQGEDAEGEDGEAGDDDILPPSRHEEVSKALANLQTIPEDEIPTKIPAKTESEEFPYVVILNRLLPSDIRVQAWSPVKPTFSSRFDCCYRHYKYFFTEGAPWVRGRSDGKAVVMDPSLDIGAMREAAQKLLGEHDFQNLCKIDGSKQITNFRRRIDGVSIDVVNRGWPRGANMADAAADRCADDERMFVLNLRGTAFLYHQVRHIMAVLLLVGAGLEKPGVIDELLNTESGRVYKDRLLLARLNKLVLDDRGDSLATELPGSSATRVDGQTSLEVARAAHVQRQHDAAAALANKEDDDCLTPQQRVALDPLRDAFVFDRKPAYELASDRPLMLWECGFRSRDVQWRAGPYDGPLPTTLSSSSASVERIPNDANINSPTLATRKGMHALWTQHAIAAEMQKHMLLALPFDGDDKAMGIGAGAGYLPSSTCYAESCFPSSESRSIAKELIADAVDERSLARARAYSSGVNKAIPLGYGRTKGQPSYRGLRHVQRSESPAEMNMRYRKGKGARRLKRIEDSTAQDKGDD